MTREPERGPEIGHNGGPSLDEERTPPPRGATCGDCRHWRAPHPGEQQRFDHWQRTGSGQRVKEPSGVCHDIQMKPRTSPVKTFGGRVARSFACYAFEPKPPHPGRTGERGGFTTVWQGERVVWSGWERDLPAEYRQEDLGL